MTINDSIVDAVRQAYIDDYMLETDRLAMTTSPFAKVFPNPPPVAPITHHCAYCGQTSPDDSRGGCAACGGPRRSEDEGREEMWRYMNVMMSMRLGL